MPDFPSQFWRDAIAGRPVNIHDGEPQSGYYREKSGNRVAYWHDTKTGVLRCQSNGRDVGTRGEEMWQWVANRPVTEEAFYHHEKTGSWPDQDVAAQKIQEGAGIDPETDPVGAAKAALVVAKEAKAKDYTKIESDEVSARAQTLRDTLNGIATALDKKREERVRPHLDAQRDINGEFNPVIKDLRALSVEIRTAMEGWENIKRDQARIAAEKTAREAAELAAKNAELESQGKPPVQPTLVPAASNAPAPATQVKGATGRAANVGNRKVVTITDIDKLFQHFKGNTALIECLQKLAKAQVDMDIAVPGVEVKIEAAVR